MLINAFVSVPGGKSPSDAQNDISIYSLSYADRKLLAKGPKMHIRDSWCHLDIELPLALFHATSTKKDLVTTNTVNQRSEIALPDNLDSEMVIELVQHLKNLVTWKQHPRMLSSYKSTYKDLQLCSVGEYLGMKIYTQHIFNWYWARIRSGHLPSYADIDAFTAVETPVGESLFKKLVNYIAKLDFENRIPDPVEYKEYSQSNQRFGTAVALARAKIQAHFDYLDRKNREEAEAARQAAFTAERNKVRIKAAKDKAAQEKAKWDEKKKVEADLAARVKTKMTSSGKKVWKPDEAGYIRRVYGKNVPA